MWKRTLAILTAAAMAGSAIQPVAAQGYDRSGQRYDNDRYDNNRDRNDVRRAEAYRHDYRADQDPYYRGCRQQRAGNTAGGLIIGAIAGGLLGNTITRGRSRGAGTALGAIAGGAIGASIGGNLSCEDRGYAYNAYYSGFEAGRPHHRYDWRNPRSGDYGYLEVGNYYRDRDGYRCATYTQRIYVHGRPELAHGHACRQRDGYWAFVD